MTIKARSNQSLIDIALQEYGSVEGLVDLAMRNGKSITDLLQIGETLQLGEPTNADIVKFYVGRKIKVATGAEALILSQPYQIGNGLYFDGVNDYVSIPYHPSFDFDHTDSFTVACWLKTGASLTGTNGSNNVVSKLKISPNISGWSINYSPTGVPNTQLFKAFGATPEQAENYEVNYTFSPNTLYHLVAIYDNHSYKFYVNGVLQTGFVVGSVTESIKSGSSLDIGGNRYFSQSGNFGTKIFNKALSNLEVTDLYNLIIPNSAIGNLVIDMPNENLYTTLGNVYTPKLVGANDGQLIGYSSGAKGIIDPNNNDIQLVP